MSLETLPLPSLDGADCILVTGGYGCIGVPAVKWLLSNTHAHVIVAGRDISSERTQRLFSGTDQTRLTPVAIDVRDRSQIERVLSTAGVTHVIHLAALQTPDCNANRDTGLQVNLAGTQNLLESIKICCPKLKRFVFASSIAVYGRRDMYPGDVVPMLAEPAPVNVYGVWKLAGEQLSKIFSLETGIPTVSLRPGVLFGPGRDAGLTAATTTAIKSVVLGRPFEIPFRGRMDYQFSQDVGAAFGSAAILPFSGYGVFTLPGNTVETVDVIAALRTAATEAGIEAPFRITAGNDTVPFICDLDFDLFCQTFPGTPRTTFSRAVRESLAYFQQQRESGWLKEPAN